MGIRFRCHHCEHELHVKDFQAGRRGKCPSCQGRFRIPPESAEHSLEIVSGEKAAAELQTAATPQTLSAAADEATNSAATSHGAKSETLSRDSQTPMATAQADAIQASTTAAESDNRSVESEPVAFESEGTSLSADDAIPRDVPPPPTSSHSMPSILAESAGAAWYVRPPTGGQYGPAEYDVFWNWIQEERVSRDALIWRDGWDEWQVASNVLADHFGSAASLPQTPQQAPSLDTAPQPNSAEPQSLDPLASSMTQTEVNQRTQSHGERNRETRKQRRRKNYQITVVLLIVAAIVLLVALAIVLVMQQG